MSVTIPEALPNGPLSGVRVVDLTSMISGPVATMMLADQGADIIKVEALSGDLVRGAGPNRSGITSTFISSNRSKRSIAVDLKQASGKQILSELLKTADGGASWNPATGTSSDRPGWRRPSGAICA